MNLKQTLRNIRHSLTEVKYHRPLTDEESDELGRTLDLARGICDECRGNGEFLHDTYDHRGEHVQSVDKCHKCNGTGRVE